MASKRSQMGTLLMFFVVFFGASVQKRIRESKKSYAKIVIHLMVDKNPKATMRL